QRADARISLQLGNIDTHNPALLCHPPIPFLARAGSHAHATVRVEGSTGPVPRSPSGSASGGDGLRSSDGRLLFTAARSHTLSNFRHTRVAAGDSPRAGEGVGRRDLHSPPHPNPLPRRGRGDSLVRFYPSRN